MFVKGTVDYWDPKGFGFAKALVKIQGEETELNVYFQRDRYWSMRPGRAEPEWTAVEEEAGNVTDPEVGDKLFLDIRPNGPKGPIARRWTFESVRQDVFRIMSVRNSKNQANRPGVSQFRIAQAISS